jgi:hypothetical protein
MQMPTFSFKKVVSALLCSLAVVACGPPDEADRVKSGPIVGSFVVSDYFTPSGLMGDGEIPGRVTVGINKNCRSPRPAGAQGDCYHFLYQPVDVHWAGAYWVFPSNSWGTVPGRSVNPPLDLGADGKGGELHGYTQVKFWAAVDPMPVAPNFQYFVGGIDGRAAKPPQPYYDKGCLIFAADTTTVPPTERSVFCDAFRNAPQNTISPLTGQWQQYVLPMNTWGLESIIGAFGFAINDTENPGQTLSIYFDDIVWE